MFYYENKSVYPVYISDKSCKDSIDLLLVGDHYVYIKDFNRLMFSKTKNENKKWFCKSCLQCFSSFSGFANVLKKHKKYCLILNGCQSVKLEKGFI